MKSLVLPSVIGLVCGLMHANAATLQISPTSVTVTNGNPVTLSVLINGIGPPPATEVGSFDIFVGFNPALVMPAEVTFGSFLGDPNAFEALTLSMFTAKDVEAVEVSLLTNSQLDALQTTSGFSLANISFNAIGSGVANFTYDGGPVDNGNGQLIAGTKLVVPEPSLFAPLAWILSGCAGWKLRRKSRTDSRIRKRARITIVFLSALFAVTSLRADSTAIAQSKHNPEMVNGMFKYPQVDTKCSLTVKNVPGTPSQGTLEVSCKFTNTTAQGWTFVYCSMLGLKNKAGTNRKAPNNSPNFGLMPVPATGKTFK